MKDSQKPKKKRLFKKINLNKPTEKVLHSSFNPNSKASNQNSFRKKKNTLFFLLIPLILLTAFAALYSLNRNIYQNIEKSEMYSLSKSEIAPIPVLRYVYQPELTARAAVVMDADSKTVLFSKNSDLRLSMASTAKIMTAFVANEYYQADSALTIKSRGIQGSVLGLQFGDKFYYDDLLYAMLLPSANDAAVAIVDNYTPGRNEFVEKMNEKARNWHLFSTNFSDPTGLDDDGNFTTAIDLARLGSIVTKDNKLSKVTATQQKIITNQRRSKQYVLSNLNRLLGASGVNGIKTGTTEGAGEVLLTSAVQHGRTFIIVVMNSQDRFGDTSVLLDYVVTNVELVKLDAPVENL